MKKLLPAVPLLAAVSALAQPARPIETPWQRVCSVAGPKPLHITTATGEIEGYCVAVDVDSITIRGTDNKLVKVGRNTYSRIMLVVGERHPLRALGREMRKSFRMGFDALLSPAAVIGLVQIPATAAWGAVSAPFCVLGELNSKRPAEREINIL